MVEVRYRKKVKRKDEKEVRFEKYYHEYADRILKSWKDFGVHHKADITKADAAFLASKKKPSQSPSFSKNNFNQFQQNNYDFDALEKELLSN